MKTIEIINETTEEIIFTEEATDEEAGKLLYRAKLTAELKTRDNEDDFTARFKPEPIEEVSEEYKVCHELM